MPIAKGEAAPRAGFLLSQERAVALGSALETCEARAALDAELAASQAEVARKACNASKAVGAAAEIERVRVLTEALDDAHEAARREWWQLPEVIVPLAAVGGALVGAGLVLGAVAVLR